MNDLPLRPKRLSPDELEGVFGGCIKRGSRGCKKNKDCCDGLRCHHISAVQGLGWTGGMTRDATLKSVKSQCNR